MGACPNLLSYHHCSHVSWPKTGQVEMLRFYWTPVVASRVHVFYPPMTREAPWSRNVLACVCLCQQTKQMTFWEIGVGLWSTAHFGYNSGGSRGGAWEPRAPPPYLRVWMTRRPYPLPPLSEGLDPPLYNNIATTHLCLQSLCLPCSPCSRKILRYFESQNLRLALCFFSGWNRI